MKCHKEVGLWKGINSRDDLEKILPSPWKIISFLDFNRAKSMGKGNKAHAICAVPTGIDKPCKELLQILHEAIDEATDPDDGEAGHIGETARTYGRGSSKKSG